MCPQRIRPATRHQPHPPTNQPSHIFPPHATRNRIHTSQQRTMTDYFRLNTNNSINNLQQHITAQRAPQPNNLPPDNFSQTPPTTPVDIDLTRLPPPSQQPLPTTTPHQQPLHSDKSNEPWGDIWALPMMEKMFRIVSKNTGTLNPQNLDMQAITNELIWIRASVFAAQETNVHWDPLTKYQTYNQCKSATAQVKLTTASSQETTDDWYKPGGTLLLTLDPWTSRIVSQGYDTVLGRWAYQAFLG